MTYFKNNDQLAKLNTNSIMIDKVFNVLVQDANTFTHLPMPISKKELVKVDHVKELTCEDFFDSLLNKYFFDDIIQDAIMTQEKTKGIKNMMGSLIEEANNQNVWLKDLHDFDYDTVFFDVIKNYQL